MKPFSSFAQQSGTIRYKRPAVASLLLLTALGLSACGSGSDEEKTPAPAPTPPPPTVASSCAAFPQATGASVTGSLSSTATAGSTGPLTYSLVSQPGFGTLSLAASGGAWTYTPTTPARGYTDSFTWKVSDAAGGSSQATASVIYGKRRIMPLGDSITQGVEAFDGNNDLPADPLKIGYRKRLQELLSAGGYEADFVGSLQNGTTAGIADPQHEGHSGFTATQIDGSVSGWIASAKPDVVLLHIGTNDLNQAFNQDPTPANMTAAAQSAATTVNTILGKIGTFAANAQNPPIGLVLATIVPQRAETGNTITPTFNTNLGSLFNASWADAVNPNDRLRVRLANMFSPINPATDLTPPAQDVSGLHPNASGYQKMAQVWYDKLVQEGLISRCP